MKKLFYSHPDTVIAILALIFFGILVAFYSWASGAIFDEVHQALTFTPSTQSNSFNLSGAAALDLRGLVGNPPPVIQPAAPVATSSIPLTPSSSPTSTIRSSSTTNQLK